MTSLPVRAGVVIAAGAPHLVAVQDFQRVTRGLSWFELWDPREGEADRMVGLYSVTESGEFGGGVVDTRAGIRMGYGDLAAFVAALMLEAIL
jgi:hypothetical protein